ncbi:MAG: RagB/SusD family nutrient uptake outer membrane protein [Cyclobacteriaceae bacterium]|nr:RagB/SusD family nutrient uptake outer membrane protein [Cyclobacteriaceae bacterium SS2]
MKKYIFLTLIMVGLVFACEESLNVQNPNSLTPDSFFQTEQQAISSVNAIYAGLQANNLYNREYFFLHDLLSDDNQSGGGQLETARAQILLHTFDATNKLTNDVWRGWFRIVLRANFAIQSLPGAEGISDALKSRLIAEAHFMRAWAYFELVSLWGGVPIYTEPSTTPGGEPRATEDAVYTMIFADLDIAEQDLPLKSEYSASDMGRATKGAAQALKGKIHMFRGDYADARTELNKVVASNEYSLVDRWLDNFEAENENNSESILEVQFSLNHGTGGAWNGDGTGTAEITFRSQEYSATAWRNVIPSFAFINAFEAGDPRFGYSFWEIGEFYNNGTTELVAEDIQGNNPAISWQKYSWLYKEPSDNSRSDINFRVIRYADVLLMLAEAENELDNPGPAVTYLNMTRNRADVAMPNYPTVDYPTGTKDEIFAAIVHERQVEFGSEQIRNRDLRRWRRQGFMTNTVRFPGGDPMADRFQAKHDLMPLPVVELDNNRSLESSDQNPNW